MNKKIIFLLKLFIIIIFCLIFNLSKENFIIIFFSWCINVIVIKKVQLIQNKSYEHYLTFVRRTLYLLPLLVPNLFFKVPFTMTHGNSLIKSICIGGLIGIIFLLPHIQNYKMYFDSNFIIFLEKKKLYKVLANNYTLFFGAIFEELYFKKVVLGLTKNILGPISIIFSSLLFFFHHYSTNKFDKFNSFDFINQIIFGITSGIVYYYSNDIIVCIIAHVVYNSPQIILNIKLLERKERYDEQLR